MESCQINVDGLGHLTARIHTTSSGQGHETLVSTVLGEVLEIDPSSIRITRPNSLESLLETRLSVVGWQLCSVVRQRGAQKN